MGRSCLVCIKKGGLSSILDLPVNLQPNLNEFASKMKLFGHTFSVRPLFLGFWLLYCLSTLDLKTQTGWIQAGVLFPAFFLMMFWHELGHIIMHRRYGAKKLSTVFGPYGGRTESDAPLRISQRIFTAMAGPIFSIILGLIALGLEFVPAIRAQGDLWTDTLLLFVISNFFWAGINMIPVYPLDCGRVVDALYPNSRIILSIVGILVSILFIGACVLMVKYPGVLLFGALLFYNVRRLFNKPLHQTPLDNS